VPLGIERLAHRADRLDALTREDLLHLPKHHLHPLDDSLGRMHAHGPLDAVDRLQPLAQHRLPVLGDAPAHLLLRPLAVVVEVGQRPLVAVLHPGQLGLVVAGGRLRRRRLGLPLARLDVPLGDGPPLGGRLLRCDLRRMHGAGLRVAIPG
jgi:hypothetical protein